MMQQLKFAQANISFLINFIVQRICEPWRHVSFTFAGDGTGVTDVNVFHEFGLKETIKFDR